MNILQKLRQLTDSIGQNADPLKTQDDWALAGRLLGRLPVDQTAASAAIQNQSHAELDAIVAKLENPTPPTQQTVPTTTFSTDDQNGPAKSTVWRFQR